MTNSSSKPYYHLSAQSLKPWVAVWQQWRGEHHGWYMGLEKECLRVDSQGRLAQTSHPEALGPPLYHTAITTDFAESMIEMITPPMRSTSALIEKLYALHWAVDQSLEQGEQLWPLSLFCDHSEHEVEIAQYGEGHLAKYHRQYRQGLALRYGQLMQLFSGVHVNVSFDASIWPAYAALHGLSGPHREAQDRGYFHVLRNIERLGWLLVNRFGASPTLNDTLRQQVDPAGYQDAISLRMSDVGYANAGDKKVELSDASLTAYLADMREALVTPVAAYKPFFGRQINAMQLQSESEYYAFVRPKPAAETTSRVWRALHDQGVAYLELRGFDLDPFSPVGIDEATLKYVVLVLWYALMLPSPAIDDSERQRIQSDRTRMAIRGRSAQKPSIHYRGRQHASAELMRLIELDLAHLAMQLDEVCHGGYHDALRQIQARNRLSEVMVLDMAGRSHQAYGEQVMRAHRPLRSVAPSSDEQQYIRSTRDLAYKKMTQAHAKEAGLTYVDWLKRREKELLVLS